MAEVRFSDPRAAASIRTLGNRLGLPYLLDGFTARTFENSGLTVDRNGGSDATAAALALFDAAAASDDAVELLPGRFRTSAEVLIRPGLATVAGAGDRTVFLPQANTYNGVRMLGNNSYDRGNRRIGRFRVQGPANAQPPRNGKHAFVLDQAPVTKVEHIRADGFDISFGALRNCGNTDWTGIRSNRGASRANVALNMGPGGVSGSDWNVYGAQLAGLCTPIAVAGQNGGLRVYGGSFGTYGLPTEDDLLTDRFGALITLGWDHLEQKVLSGLGSVLVSGFHCEGWRRRYMVRAYGSADFEISGAAGINPSVRDPAEMALGLYKHTEATDSVSWWRGNSIGGGGGHLARAAAAIEGQHDDFDIQDGYGWHSAAMTVAGVQRGRGWLKSLASESNLRGDPRQRSGGFGQAPGGYPEIMLGRSRLRLNGTVGTFEQSMDNGATYGRAFRAHRVDRNGGEVPVEAWWSEIDFRSDGDAPTTLTVPPDRVAGAVAGCRVQLHQLGTGRLAVTAGPGVTIRRLAGRSTALAGRDGVAWLEKLDADTWRLWGDLGAV